MLICFDLKALESFILSASYNEQECLTGTNCFLPKLKLFGCFTWEISVFEFLSSLLSLAGSGREKCDVTYVCAPINNYILIKIWLKATVNQIWLNHTQVLDRNIYFETKFSGSLMIYKLVNVIYSCC